MIQKTPLETLNLLFPQWQGSGTTNELYTGAMLLYEHLQKLAKFEFVPVKPKQKLNVEREILGYSSILQQLSEAKKIIQTYNPSRIFVIGGDCGIDVAPISFLNQKYDRDLAVVWLDAHGDLNTPTSSPSKHFHGMPLRVLLGEGDDQIIQLSFSRLHPKQVFLVGARDFDRSETSYLKQEKISLFPPKTIENNYKEIIKAIAKTNCNHLYIHCDLDVIDPIYFPFVKCPASGGLSLEVIKLLLQELKSHFNVVGFSVTESAAVDESALARIESLVNVTKKIMSK